MKKWLALCAVVGCALAAFAQAEPPALTSAQYDQLSKDNQVFVLVFTTGKYCPPCRSAHQTVLPQLQQMYAQTENVQVYQVNVDAPAEKESNSLKARYGVRGTPTFVVLVNDSAQFFHEGFNTKAPEKLLNQIAETVNKFK